VQRYLTSIVETIDLGFDKAEESVFVAHSVLLMRVRLSQIEELLDDVVASAELVLSLLVFVFSIGKSVGFCCR
jgi:hypothetical protein